MERVHDTPGGERRKAGGWGGDLRRDGSRKRGAGRAKTIF